MGFQIVAPCGKTWVLFRIHPGSLKGSTWTRLEPSGFPRGSILGHAGLLGPAWNRVHGSLRSILFWIRDGPLSPSRNPIVPRWVRCERWCALPRPDREPTRFLHGFCWWALIRPPLTHSPIPIETPFGTKAVPIETPNFELEHRETQN